MDLDALVSLPVVLAAVALALVFVMLGVALARWWSGVLARDRGRDAQRGEHDAERILMEAGFTIVARQSTATWQMAIDDELVDVSVRVDLIVERRGHRYVAEVKTGQRAPDPCFPATRRQLLEYSLVFGASHVLLVDVPSRSIHTVAFPAIEMAAAA